MGGAWRTWRRTPAASRHAWTRRFIDDTFANVQGARRAGLHADTARDARALRRVLVRYGLA